MSAPQPLPADIRLMHALTAALWLLAGAMALAALAWWGMRHAAFGIAGISVQGDVAHHNAITLRANVAPRLTGTFFTVDLREARAAFESLPWVRKAVVHREFPNRLRVQLQEHQAAAYWGAQGGEGRLVNHFGELFDANTDDLGDADLPRLNGPDSQSLTVLQMFRALAPRFEKLDLVLDELELSQRGTWRAHLDNGGVVELGGGTEQELLTRLERFSATVTQISARYGRRVGVDLESADLRHKDGYALRLRGVTTVTALEPKK